MNITKRISLAALLCAGSALGADEYLVTDLGSLGDATIAAGINESGVSVGYAVDVLYRYHGWVNTNGSFDQVSAMGSMQAQGQMLGINDFNQSIFASYMLGMLSTNAVIYNNGMTTSLGMMMPCAINNSDRVVGSRFVIASNGLRNELACSWENGGITNLPSLSNATSSLAKGINDAGWVVGSSIQSGAITPTATLWENTSAHDLGTLGGAWSQAFAINASNQVTGIAQTANAETHAFRFDLDANGGVINRVDLGALSGGYSVGHAISDEGLIVGSSGNRAVLWENGQLIDLNTRIAGDSTWVLNNATGVNESGQIVGVGAKGGDPFRAFLLTPRVNCAADLNKDGMLNFFDVSVLITGYMNQDPIADFNNDGSWNFFDISAFIMAYNAGCP